MYGLGGGRGVFKVTVLRMAGTGAPAYKNRGEKGGNGKQTVKVKGKRKKGRGSRRGERGNTVC